MQIYIFTVAQNVKKLSDTYIGGANKSIEVGRKKKQEYK